MTTAPEVPPSLPASEEKTADEKAAGEKAAEQAQAEEKAEEPKAVSSAGGRKLPPVPVFENSKASKNGDEADTEGASGKTTVDDAQMEAETDDEEGSGSSSGSDDEGEEEEDDAAEDMEVDAEADGSSGVAEKPVARSKLFKLGEFCCNVAISHVSGSKEHEEMLERFNIDQRIKVDRCRLHIEQAGDQVTVWHFIVAGKKGRAPYQALCDYFVEKDRVGLVDTPSYYMYVVPPGGKFLAELGLAASKALVGIQVPKDRAEG